MEHRWGERSRVDLAVQLRISPGLTLMGRLHDVSISGCRVVASRIGTLRHCREVEVVIAMGDAAHEALHIRGCIVRRTATGFGIEWSELDPQGLRHLLPPGMHATTGSIASPPLRARASAQ